MGLRSMLWILLGSLCMGCDRLSSREEAWNIFFSSYPEQTKEMALTFVQFFEKETGISKAKGPHNQRYKDYFDPIFAKPQWSIDSTGYGISYIHQRQVFDSFSDSLLVDIWSIGHDWPLTPDSRPEIHLSYNGVYWNHMEELAKTDRALFDLFLVTHAMGLSPHDILNGCKYGWIDFTKMSHQYVAAIHVLTHNDRLFRGPTDLYGPSYYNLHIRDEEKPESPSGRTDSSFHEIEPM